MSLVRTRLSPLYFDVVVFAEDYIRNYFFHINLNFWWWLVGLTVHTWWFLVQSHFIFNSLKNKVSCQCSRNPSLFRSARIIEKPCIREPTPLFDPTIITLYAYIFITFTCAASAVPVPITFASSIWNVFQIRTKCFCNRDI